MTDKQLETVIEDIAGPGWLCPLPRKWGKINNILSHHCYPKETERTVPYTDSDDLSEQNELENSNQFYTITNAIKPLQFPTALIFGGWDSSDSTKKERFLEQLKWARDKSKLALNDILAYVYKLGPQDFHYDETWLSSLGEAISRGDIADMMHYLKKGAPVHSNSKHVYLLNEATRLSFEEGVKLLLDSGAKELKDELGNTPLHNLAKSLGSGISRNRNILKMLIDYGADVNDLNKNHETPLDMAVDYHEPEIADLLRKHGGKHGSINGAAVGGDTEAVKEFLATGTDVNAKNYYGETPLHLAGKHGQKEIAELLIAEGADVNAKNNYGKTPLHHSSGAGHREIVELLIAGGSDVNAKAEDDETPLDLAKRHPETAELLRKRGGKHGTIHTAARGGSIEEVKQHLTAGGDVNAKTKYEETPLHLATEWGLVELLIAKNANVNAKNDFGATPLDLASGRKHPKITDLLRKHGGKTGEELEAEGK